MPTHKEKRVLPYTKDQMFDIVADVDSYPSFLPWCVAARVKRREQVDSEEILTADLAVRFKMFREKFSSRAVLNRPLQTIRVEYLDGPFEFLENDWAFSDHTNGCEIDFFIEFRFRSVMLDGLISGMFNEAVHRMVSAFEERAAELHGNKDQISI